MKMMRILLATALLLCLAMTAALAIAPHPDTRSELPSDIMDFFSAEKYRDDLVMHGHQVGDYYFVMVRRGESANILYGFKKNDNGWKYWMQNQNTIPQGGYCVDVQNHTGQEYYSGNGSYTLPTLCIMRSDDEYEYRDFCAYYSLRNGVWQVEEIHDVNSDTRILFDPDLLIYYGGDDALRRIGTVSATVQRDIRYISLDTIPTDYQDAKDKLTVAPSLPASAELQAQNIKFTGGRKYDVYSAPTETSYRGANGKAAVSTNSWIQVFGVEDGWAMIQYSIDADHYRIGYIVEEALPASADIPTLNFSPIPAWTSRGVTLTDDPFFSGADMITLPLYSDVQWLSTIGSWAYVEISSPYLMRGFVPASALFTDPEILHQALTTPVPGANQ